MLNKCKAGLKECNDPQSEDSTDSIQPQYIMAHKDINEPIEICEIHWTLRKYFPTIPQRCAITIAKLIDENNDGSIQQSQFNKLIKQLQQVLKAEDILNIIFTSSDQNQKGIIDQRQIQILKEKMRLNFVMPTKPMNLQEFKLFMAMYTDQITGKEYIPFTSEIQEKPKNTNSFNQSTNNIKNIVKQDDVLQKSKL
ncbi:EF-hand_domain pair [Hexamita inflata]|uniref:EF-hand domain pair n=1 Tax=Hexamita inflata TaxID=28002 RepID=A0AA86P6G8_9EUKA|nr:EF-hand domain pair [Hexamita inflata]